MEDPTLPDISFLQNAPFSCRFLVPQNQTYQFLILAQTQKWRKHLPDKISKLLFQVWKNILKIPIYLSTCLSIGWCTTFITFVSWSCPFSLFSQPPWPETSKPLTPSSPSHSSQSSAKTPPGPRRPRSHKSIIWHVWPIFLCGYWVNF